jgi:phage baseplate assembly protein W
MTTAYSRYRDFDISFNPSPSNGDVIMVTQERAIAQSIRSLVMTNQYERLFNPDLSCDVYSLLFELPSELVDDEIKKRIRTAIENYESRASLIDVIVQNDLDAGGIDVTIIYRSKVSTRDLTIKLFLSRVN